MSQQHASAAVQQVGGSHYGGGFNQHWDLVAKFDLEYLPATATAYIARWDLKGTPVIDLEKAVSYLVKFQQTRQFPLTGCLRTVPPEYMLGFFLDNGWSADVPREAEKRLMFDLIHVDGSSLSIRTAINLLGTMIDRERRAQEKLAQPG